MIMFNNILIKPTVLSQHQSDKKMIMQTVKERLISNKHSKLIRRIKLTSAQLLCELAHILSKGFKTVYRSKDVTKNLDEETFKVKQLINRHKISETFRIIFHRLDSLRVNTANLMQVKDIFAMRII